MIWQKNAGNHHLQNHETRETDDVEKPISAPLARETNVITRNLQQKNRAAETLFSLFFSRKGIIDAGTVMIRSHLIWSTN
jgi:hypothetical protein